MARTNVIQILHSASTAAPNTTLDGDVGALDGPLAKGELAWVDHGSGGANGKLYIGDATAAGAEQRHIGGVGTGAAPAAASTLTGNTLASGVTGSSLTSVGTLTSLATGAITGTGATNAFSSSTASSPLMTMTNTANDATAPIIKFANDKGGAGAAGDDVGSIEFYGDNDAQEQTAYGKILTEIGTGGHANGDEAGKMSLFVAESNGSASQLTAGLILQGEEGTDGEVDAWIGAGSASTTTIAGDASVGGALTVTGDLNITGDVNTTTVTDLDVVDKTITVASGAADSAAADGAGLIVGGASAQILYAHSGTQFECNKEFNCSSGFVGDLTGTADAVTNATLTTALTVNTGTLTLTANAADNSVLTIGAGAVSVAGSTSGTNTGDQTLPTRDSLSIDTDDAVTFAGVTSTGLITATHASGVLIKDATASSATEGGNLVLASDDGAAMATGHRLGVLEFKGAEDTSDTITVGARIEAVSDATWGASENGADLVFYTTDADVASSTAGEGQSAALTVYSDKTKGVRILNETTSAAGEGAKLVLATDDGALLADDHRIGVIEFQAAEDGSSTMQTGAKIQALADATWSGSVNDTRLEFYTMDGDAGSELSLTLDSNKLASFTGAVTSAAGLTGTTGTFSGEVTGAGFTGTLDGVLGGGTPAGATVTTLVSTGVTTIGNNSATVAINSSDWDISTTGTITNALISGGTF